MLGHITLILLFQLVGEIAVRAAQLPVPGPVLGMVLLLALLLARPALAPAMEPTARGILAHLSLLFVPAGVGMMGHLGALGADGPAIAAALVLSTLSAIAVGALVFSGLARLVGTEDEDAEQARADD
ncbi:MAG: CidA/LrgA family protein [Rhodobacteraceae bacterium]|nr:CidA/LrgA family protein [Paracoccaceae bacterium]